MAVRGYCAQGTKSEFNISSEQLSRILRYGGFDCWKCYTLW
jgi:hypothetical protein